MALVVKNLPTNSGDRRDLGSIPGLGIFPGEENGFSFAKREPTWQPTPVFSPVKFHGQGILVGLQSMGSHESDVTEHG